MLCEHIVVSQAELNSGSGIIKNVTETSIDSTIALGTGDFNYYTKSVEVANSTGATIYFLPLTKIDYRGWVNNITVTDLIPVADSASKEITSLKGHVEYELCSGVTGHSADLTLVLTKEY